MNEFLKFFNEIVPSYPMHLDISYSKIMDWTIHINKSCCAMDGGDLDILTVNETDMELCFAKAYVQLKEWLLENLGGY